MCQVLLLIFMYVTFCKPPKVEIGVSAIIISPYLQIGAAAVQAHKGQVLAPEYSPITAVLPCLMSWIPSTL